jgi:hypothetical protein
MRVIEHTPPAPVQLEPGSRSLFFQGPIQGAPDWQANGVENVRDYSSDEEIHILNPRRKEEATKGTFEGEKYREQIFWEQDHIILAADTGGLLVWLEPQDHSLPYPKGREYAKTTKKELSMSIGAILIARKQLVIAVGIDPNFEDKERYLRTTFERLNIPIHTTLEDTCHDALAQLGY